MTQDPRLGDLLLDWEEAVQQGRPVSAEELCRDCPELLDDLRRQIQALETIAPGPGFACPFQGPRRRDRQLPSANPRASDQATRAETSPNPLLPGFEILGTLGRGGMGVVYKARQSGLERLVALKMVLAGQHASPQERARFDSEARLIARLNHPHIVQIYALGEYERTPYFVMEYMDGRQPGEGPARPTVAAASGRPGRRTTGPRRPPCPSAGDHPSRPQAGQCAAPRQPGAAHGPNRAGHPQDLRFRPGPPPGTGTADAPRHAWSAPPSTWHRNRPSSMARLVPAPIFTVSESCSTKC